MFYSLAIGQLLQIVFIKEQNIIPFYPVTVAFNVVKHLQNKFLFELFHYSSYEVSFSN